MKGGRKKTKTNAKPTKRRLFEFTSEQGSGMRADSSIISAASLQALAGRQRKSLGCSGELKPLRWEEGNRNKEAQSLRNQPGSNIRRI